MAEQKPFFLAKQVTEVNKNSTSYTSVVKKRRRKRKKRKIKKGSGARLGMSGVGEFLHLIVQFGKVGKYIFVKIQVGSLRVVAKHLTHTR